MLLSTLAWTASTIDAMLKVQQFKSSLSSLEIYGQINLQQCASFKIVKYVCSARM